VACSESVQPDYRCRYDSRYTACHTVDNGNYPLRPGEALSTGNSGLDCVCRSFTCCQLMRPQTGRFQAVSDD
jgi:hypothetical protein